MTDPIDGGKLVARALKDEGVRVVFTLCGGHIMPIYGGCLDEGIRVIDVRHEQAATMAADGWARLTGDAGVAMVTAGPGVMNGMTGIANAQRSDSPLVTIGGAADLARFEHGSLQEGPQVPVVAPLTKWAKSCYQTNRLEDYVHQSIRQATSPRTGPTFLEVPWDILWAEATPAAYASGEKRAFVRPRPDEAQVRRAAKLLAEAERPAVLVGGGIHWSRGARSLVAFADAVEAPFYLNGLARGGLPPKHAHFFSLSRGKALESADVLLNVGTPFDFRMNYGEGVAKDVRVIHADVDATQLGQVRPFDVGLVGNLGAVLDDLGAALKHARVASRKQWLATLRDEEQRRRAAQQPGRTSDAKPIHAQRLAAAVNDALTDDTILIGDGGNIVALAAKIIEVPGTGQWMDPGPYGTLGIGLPFALAAKLHAPTKRVMVLQGDGALGLNGFEIDTAVRHNLPMVVVVGNDGAWNQIRDPQVTFYGEERAVATKLGERTRYDLFAEAFGGHGELVEDPHELKPAIERAFASGKPAIVNVLIDRATNKGSGKPM
ncbi:MAG: thiamine pyrophosphate-binding protein [Thermoplasmatota archaeon]